MKNRRHHFMLGLLGLTLIACSADSKAPESSGSSARDAAAVSGDAGQHPAEPHL
jgi:hypothetical protein